MDEFNFPPTVFTENLMFSLMTVYYIDNFFKKNAIFKKYMGWGDWK